MLVAIDTGEFQKVFVPPLRGGMEIKMKKLLCSFLCCLLLCSLISCEMIDRLKGDMSKISYDDNDNLLYGGNSYYRADHYFEVRTTADDAVVDLGWYSQFPFFPDMHFYAFDEEDPLFIFCDNSPSSIYNKGFLVRSDYDVQSKLLIIEDTDMEISLSSAMTKSDVAVSSISHEKYTYFRMYLKDDPRIQIDLSGPYSFNDNWYFIHSGETYILSNELVELLNECGIIKK